MLSTTVNADESALRSGGMARRFGPSASMCSGYDGLIGPPLQTKITGRVARSTPVAVYAVLTMSAAGLPAPLGTSVSPTVAVYVTRLPLNVPSCCVTAGGNCGGAPTDCAATGFATTAAVT